MNEYEFLKDVLVITVKKSFWASKECTIFPNRLYATVLFGHSRAIVNTLITALRSLFYCFKYKPKLIVFGSSSGVVPFFIIFKMLGLIPSVKIITTTHLYFSDSAVKHIDKIIVYSKSQIARHKPSIRNKYIFIPLPADGIFKEKSEHPSELFIFSGGSDTRDFQALIRAIEKLDIQLKIVTNSPKHLNFNGKIPENCNVYWKMPLQNFLKLMAESLFVVVPLLKGNIPHGHTTIVQAFCSGKAVLSNSDASVEDYISNGKEGILVPPGNIEAYQEAILKLYHDHTFRKQCEAGAKLKAKELTYESFANRLINLCKEVIAN